MTEYIPHDWLSGVIHDAENPRPLWEARAERSKRLLVYGDRVDVSIRAAVEHQEGSFAYVSVKFRSTFTGWEAIEDDYIATFANGVRLVGADSMGLAWDAERVVNEQGRVGY